MVKDREVLSKTYSTNSTTSTIKEFPKGLVLWIILNEVTFDVQYQLDNEGHIRFKNSIGADVDKSKIEDALKPFNIDLRVWTDMKLVDILKSLDKVKKEVDDNPTKFSGLVFLAMSHGINSYAPCSI